jgi:hypothetical protein
MRLYKYGKPRLQTLYIIRQHLTPFSPPNKDHSLLNKHRQLKHLYTIDFFRIIFYV